MFAVSTVSHRVATVPTVAKASRASKSRAPVATTRAAAREDSDVAARVMFTGRRSFAAATLAAAVAAPAPPATPKMQLGVKILLGGLATILLAVFTACIAGFLVAVREMVRACREATNRE